MALIDDLLFEVERRSIIFHQGTSMPDDSQLGYTGNPNFANPVISDGQFLLHHCPSGTHYLDKSVSPYPLQVKMEDSPGGIQTLLIDGTNVESGEVLIRKFDVTSAYESNEVIDILDGDGGISGGSIPTGNILTDIKNTSADFVNANDMQIRLNGVHLTKGFNVIQNSSTEFRFTMKLDETDRFEIIINE